MSIIGGIVDGLGKVFGLVDDLHTSDEEKLTLKQNLMQMQNEILTQAIDLEKKSVEMRGKIVEAEAESEHPLTAMWRPITMLTFLALIVYSQLFAVPIPEEMWTLLQLGLGGYVVGRSAEKVIPGVARALKQKEEA